MNYEGPSTKNTYWMVTAIIDKRFGMKKDRLMKFMSEKNIDCRPFFHSLSSLPAYAHLEQAQQARRRNQMSHQIGPYGINLPSALNMTAEKVRYVCDVLKAILQRKTE